MKELCTNKDCIDCTNCRDCTDCHNCYDCFRCKDCINCIDCDQSDNCNNCKDCINCHNCTDCKGCIHLNGVTGYIDMKPPNETEVQVKQTKDKLYSLNDLHKAAGLEGQVRDLVKNLSEKQLSRFGLGTINGRGTYANEKGVYWFAAKVNEDFEDAVFEAFKLLAQGNTEKALDTAASFVVTPELVTQITKQSEAVNAAIAIWDTHNYPHRGPKAYTCIWSHIVAKCVTGGSLTSIKKAHGVTSLADYFIKTKHKQGIGAYLAITKTLVPLLKSGVDYYVIKEALAYD